jgi:uncharacterized protein (TIGR01319 family)
LSDYILADVGSTFTKVCLVNADEPSLVASAAAPTTVGTDVNIGLDEALKRIGSPRVPAERTLVCSSAAGGLRVAAVGLVRDLTAKAATTAALGAGGKVVASFSYTLTSADRRELAELRPDIVLLAGGTDGGDEKHVVANARALNECLPETPVVFAGNRSAADAVAGVFGGDARVLFAENVLPELDRLNPAPARECIRRLFLERIVRAKGLEGLRSRASIVMPTPEAVLRAAELLSSGTAREAGLGELVAIDMGGSTTDVYSCASGRPSGANVVVKGLPEPFAKRTVEADIGLAVTLGHLMELLDEGEVAAESGTSPAEVRSWAAAVAANPAQLPRSARESGIADEVARRGCREALARHCGTLREAYTPQGRVMVQEGKDLTRVSRLIGSGGPIVYAAKAAGVLSGAVGERGSMSLAPVSPGLMLDRRYLMWAMGLLADRAPEAALDIMKRMVERIER